MDWQTIEPTYSIIQTAYWPDETELCKIIEQGKKARENDRAAYQCAAVSQQSGAARVGRTSLPDSGT